MGQKLVYISAPCSYAIYERIIVGNIFTKFDKKLSSNDEWEIEFILANGMNMPPVVGNAKYLRWLDRRMRNRKGYIQFNNGPRLMVSAIKAYNVNPHKGWTEDSL
jgi:hypothetical protein